LETSAQAKIISAPFFPYDGARFFIMSEAADPEPQVKSFVESDPYVKQGIVDEYKIKEFAMTNHMKDFDRLSLNFL